MEGQALLDYVKLVKDLETELYFNRQISSKYVDYAEKHEPRKPVEPYYTKIPDAPAKPNSNESSPATSIILLIFLGLISVILMIICILSLFDGGNGFFGTIELLFGFAFGAFFTVVAFGACYATLKEKKTKNHEIINPEKVYEQAMSSYESRCNRIKFENLQAKAAYEKSLVDYRATWGEYNRERNNMLDVFHTSRNQLQTTLNKLYDLDIIYSKYRNFVAISTIYEYLASGRCHRLDGPDGAYNLYEIELRQNIIIGQLSSIGENLNQIKNNQFTLYNEIVSANQRAASVLSDIGTNVKISAYQNEAAAKCKFRPHSHICTDF